MEQTYSRLASVITDGVRSGKGQTMRLIDADALEEKAKQYSLGYYEADEWAVPLCEISEAPSIDIVRCKECKHRPIKEDANEDDYGFNVIAPNEDERCPCLVEDGWYSWIPKDNFYCGYGEREGE